VFWSAEGQAQAETTSGGVYPVYLLDSNEDGQYFGPGVCINAGGTPIVFTRGYDSSMQAAAIAAEIEGQVCLLVYDSGSDSLSSWTIQEDSLQKLAGYESAFLLPGTPVQNEKAMAYYHYESNDELALGGTEVILQGINEDGLLEAEGFPTGILYPAAVVNSQGEMVGVLLEDNACVPLGTPEASGASTAMVPTAPPLPLPSASPLPTPQTGVGFWLLIAIGLIGILILVILLIVVAAKRKPSQGDNRQPGNIGGDGVSPGAPVPSPGAREVVSGKRQQSRKLWLVAKGGCMNGRVYPVGQNEITIGRDAAMVIRFPADTVGVSRIHAKLYWQGGQLMLMDCNSTSGTFLKRQGKLTPMAPVAVESGDVFYIGEKANSFEINTGR